ncbi:polysaccharide lyase 8 family protein [Promicromonospora sukumoe]|uniref:Hyaluronate lyase n=1 Tax=Promicromonospora sukumoe TaxID=88382 RepID=A0A7W3J628_9MICO|nr:polysaccharide lyase 8 family protein [Promicromonospora sukumoe]MBA8806958.1 hyaluronate lyase [Promicromonospora sukumoe]
MENDTATEGSGPNRRSVLRGMGTLAGLAALAPYVSLPARALPASSTTELVERWAVLQTGGPGLDLADAHVAAAVRRVDRAATTVLATLDRSAGRTALWADLADRTRSTNVTTTFKRLRSIAVAWATPGTPVSGDATVADAVADGIGWMHDTLYGPGLPRFDNDWDWEIGSASALVDTLVVLREHLGADLARSTAAVDHYTPDPNLWRADRQIATGANRVWIATVVAVRAALDGDEDALARVRDALSDVEGGGANSVLAFADEAAGAAGTGEGFFRDGSFLQHWKHPYNGGYGKELLGTLSSLLHLLGDSPWQVTDPALANVYGWVTDAFDPLMVRGDMVASVCGREIARPSKQGHASTQTVVEGTLRLIPSAPAAQAATLTALVAQWIAEDTYRDFLAGTTPASVVAAKALLAAGPTPRGPLVAQHQYPAMDKVVHHRPGFAVSVSAYSSRVYNYESIQNENLHGWHLSDGMVLLYTDDLGHYSEDYWPTVDPYRLPGTTVDTARRADGADHRATNAATWVGGATLPGTTLGGYGQDLRAQGSDLRALKSWFLLDDAVVCLGSGITAPGAAAVETVVENRKVRDGAALVVDGVDQRVTPGWNATLDDVRWCHLAGTSGYVFPDGARLHALREDRTHTWREINVKYGTDTSVTRPYLTAWLDHGAAPDGGSYAYVLLPAASPEQTRLFSAACGTADGLRVLAHDDGLHAVALGGSVAANFWGAGRVTLDGAAAPGASGAHRAGLVGALVADGAASVVLHTEPPAGGQRTTRVALSDPTQTREQVVVDLEVPGLTLVGADDGVTVTRRGAGWRLVADGVALRGATVTASFA